jgi:hypothetical protein
VDNAQRVLRALELFDLTAADLVRAGTAFQLGCRRTASTS